ncbi:hypothetical protein ACLMJK_004448 [Lecanora helva]
MTAQSSRPPERGYHQDYIARIRYENSLPPPPGAPKLLNIPTEGLKYYTSANFSSRLARQQPLNIEADAELGMPIDLVGMPGIFDGDESSIQAPLATPPVHPKDKSLLRPLSELGKPAFNSGGYSFLRRTEYISTEAKARAEANAHAARTTVKSPAAAKPRKPADTQKDDPMFMLRSAIKGFDLANPQDAYTGPDTVSNLRGAAPTPAETEAWKNPRHPSKPDVKLLDSYPLLPDLDAITDSGGFMITKFTGNPSAATEKRDTRMDVGIIYPREHESGSLDYDFFIPTDEAAADKIRQKFDVNNPDRDDPELYTQKDSDGSDHFRYNFLRTYDASRRIDTVDQQYKEVALALHDQDDNNPHSQEKGAYYYPIVTKMQLKPRRNRNLAQLGLASQAAGEEAEKIDWMTITVGEPEEGEIASRAKHREMLEAEHQRVPDGEA